MSEEKTMTTDNSSKSTLGKWDAKIVMSVATVLFSAMASWMIAWYTASQVLAVQFEQGETVFENVGFRYFDAVYHVYIRMPDRETRVLTKDPRAWRAHRIILAGVERDIEWLRKNPFYSEIRKEVGTLARVQNQLAVESTSDKRTLNRAILYVMCEIYEDSERWIRTGNENRINEDLIEFARRLCERTTVPGGSAEDQ